MSAPTYARCITGRPATTVTARGQPLLRFATIERADGSLWRYEGMCRTNTAVLASEPDRPQDVRRFAMSEFGIAIVVAHEAAA